MIKNYFTIALRNLLKQRFYAILNILGLSIGIASCLLMLLYVADELSYDRFHSKADRIYRVGLNGKIAGQEMELAVTCPPLAGTAVHEFPEVATATRLYKLESEVTRYEDVVYTETRVFFADSNFFEVFDFELLEGDPKTALQEPNTLVITEKVAKKYFGNEPALGKIVTVGDFNASYKVTGIVKTPPQNAHFHFDVLYAMSSFDYSKQDVWVSNSFYTYLLLHEGADAQALEAKLPFLVEKYVGPQVEQFMGINLEEFRNQGGRYGYFLQPLTDIHLHSRLDGEIEANSDITYVYILLAIAGFIILIACINFMNLSTARSASRAKEVGVRKTLGSLRKNLVMQFLTESIMMSIVASLIAIVLITLFLSPFNALSGKMITLNVSETPWLVAGLLGVVLLVGVIAGSYPAFYLSGFKPVEVLKGRLKAGMRSSGIRNALVVFQFAISIGLIVCTGLVYQQLDYARNKNLGFDKENVVVISNGRRLGDKAHTFKQRLLDQSQIANVSVSSGIVPRIENNTVFRPEGSDVDHLLSFYYADYDHLSTLNITLQEGRNFSPDFPTDTAAVILNETAVRELGLEEPVGQKLTYFGADTPVTLQIIGVVKDFNFQSLRNNIRPVAILFTRQGGFIAAKINPGNVTATLGMIEAQWKEQVPGEPFEYTFLDEDFDALFRAEQRLGSVFTVFTSLAIFIACLGLLGLAAYTAEQRTKEIGIRKVMGASVTSVLVMLSKEFTRLVIIAFIIAIPISYWVMNHWLSNFAYRISIGAGIFLAAGLAALLVAWLTVSFQSLKAARTNPAKSLRSE